MLTGPPPLTVAEAVTVTGKPTVGPLTGSAMVGGLGGPVGPGGMARLAPPLHPRTASAAPANRNILIL